MRIIINFDLGQKLYAIKCTSKSEVTKCHVCNGTGHIYINNEKFTCPCCNGMGTEVRNNKIGWQVVVKDEPLTAVRLQRSTTNNETFYMFQNRLGYEDTLWHPDDVFPTLEQAQWACDQRNKKLTESQK